MPGRLAAYNALLLATLVCVGCTGRQTSTEATTVRCVYYRSDRDCVERGSWTVFHKPQTSTWLVNCNGQWIEWEVPAEAAERIADATERVYRPRTQMERIGPATISYDEATQTTPVYPIVEDHRKISCKEGQALHKRLTTFVPPGGTTDWDNILIHRDCLSFARFWWDTTTDIGGPCK